MSGQKFELVRQIAFVALLSAVFLASYTSGCQIHQRGDHLKFVRLPKSLPVGERVLVLEVHPRKRLAILPVDEEGDIRYFTYKDLNKTHVSVITTRSLEDFVDVESSSSLLKFRIACDDAVDGNSSDVESPKTSNEVVVTVTVLDTKPNLLPSQFPEFEADHCNTTIVQNLPNRTNVLHVNINDKDQRKVEFLDTDCKNLPGGSCIDLKLERSPVHDRTILDRKKRNPLKIEVYAGDEKPDAINGSSSRSFPSSLPEFEVDFYNISIVENLPNGFSVLQVRTSGKDAEENESFEYDLEDSTGGFSIDPQTGWMTVRDQTILDREQRSSLKMKVFARRTRPSVDFEETEDTPSAEIVVTLLDANDNNPVFIPSNLYEFVTPSDSPSGTALGQVHAVDQDLGRNGMVLYRVQRPGNGTVRVPFTIDEHSGIISVLESPIVEGRHAIFIEASDQPANPSERRSSLAVVTVEVFNPDAQKRKDPDFVGAPYEFWVGANVGIGTSVGQIRVNEAVEKTDLIYDLLHSYPEGVPFAVEERSGMITVVDEIEQFNRSLYDFEAVVTNENQRDFTLWTNVSIHVVDPEDERGIFTQSIGKTTLVFHVKENAPGAFIGQILPHNSTSSNRNMNFLIANQHGVPEITITKDGALYTTKGLDRETRQNHSITVIAESAKGIGIFEVTVIVDDENDNAPMFDMSTYEGHIPENSPVGTEVILKKHISAHDLDERDEQNFELSLHGDGSELFTIDQTTGRIFFSGNRKDLLDREGKPVYDLRVIARDRGNLFSEAKLLITVDDENDNFPIFTQMAILPDNGIQVTRDESNPSSKLKQEIPAGQKDDEEPPQLSVPENITLGTTVIRLLATDEDAGKNGEVTYSIVNETIIRSNSKAYSKGYFAIGSTSGNVSVLQKLPAETSFLLQATATDGGGLTDNVTLLIHVKDVNDNAPIFQKSLYTFTILEGSYLDHPVGTVLATDGDFGRNGNVSYEVKKLSRSPITFSIDRYSGTLKVTGDLDRESKDNYGLSVIARDNGINRMSSTVSVEVNVLDVNDNAPVFYGYNEIGHLSTPNVDFFKNNNIDQLVPVYYSSVLENSPVGTVVIQVFANDSDSVLNGNGLVLFDLHQQQGEPRLFTIDSKSGVVSTAGQINYEQRNYHNLSITASDLGSPSLSSTAMLYVQVINVEDGEELRKPTFQHRYYEVEVEENNPVPLELVQLRVSDGLRNDRVRYSIVPNEEIESDYFTIDPKNGSLWLNAKVDRELKDSYEVKVRVDRVKNGRGMPVMIYPVSGERLNGLELNEAKIIVKVKDVNDNTPTFKANGKPMLAAIPTTAHYGYEIIKVEADDPDEGINGEIRYQILGREDAPRFAIDPLSGQVRSVGSFLRDAGHVFGFDVKATDRRGAEDGRSSIANVFVYVLDDHKQIVMVMGNKPTDIERQIENITSALHNVTGLDVRVRKLEPHIEKNLIDTSATDMYLYAVDPLRNVMIDMDTLQTVFHNKKMDIKRELEKYHILEIASSTTPRKNQKYLLSTLEVGVVVLGCVVFVGALVTALCITCMRRSKRRHQREVSMYPAGAQLGFALADSTATLQKPTLFPAFVDGLHYDPEPFSGEARHPSVYEHEPTCVRFHRSTMGKRVARTSIGGLEATATSLHSSGQDSGIVARTCHCSHSSSPSSGESSNGYEDSLKSLHRRTSSHEALQEKRILGRKANLPPSRRRQRFHSFANFEPSSSSGNVFFRERHPSDDENRKRSSAGSPGREQRLVSDTENNITETVIHEYPGSVANIPPPLPNHSTLHGKTNNIIHSTLVRRQSDGGRQDHFR